MRSPVRPDVLAAQCWVVGRIEEAVGYADADQTVIGSGGDEASFS